MGHFLQSPEWESFQHDLGLETRRASGDGWDFMGIEETGAARTTRLYAPYGPGFSSLGALEEALRAFERAARDSGDVYVRVEPVGATPEVEEGAAALLERLGYHEAPHIQPQDTWVVDVTPEKDVILKGMDPNHRRRYRGAQKRGVTVRVSHDPADIHYLISFMEDVEGRDDVTLRGAEYMRTLAEALMPSGAAALYLAEAALKDEEGNPTGEVRVVAADFVGYDDEACYLMHNGTDRDFYKLGANVIMQVQIVLDAHDLGKSRADFCGAAPEDAGPDHPWMGFTKFKMAFGGGRRHYLGTWEKPIKKLRYGIYEAGRKVLDQ